MDIKKIYTRSNITFYLLLSVTDTHILSPFGRCIKLLMQGKLRKFFAVICSFSLQTVGSALRTTNSHHIGIPRGK